MRIFTHPMGGNSQIADWQDLKYFLAVAEAGTLSGAARRLVVDHGTVSRRVGRLERDLGVKLIHRLPRNCVLTPEGEEIRRLGLAAAEVATAIEMRARGTAGAVQGSVRLSAPPALANHFLAPRLGALREKHPLLQVELWPNYAAVALDRGEADLALRLSRPREPGAVTRKVGTMTSDLYASPTLMRRAPEDWAFIAFGAELDHVPQQGWLKSILQGRQIALRLNDLTGQREAARSGLGAAVLPDFLARGDAGLTRVPLETKPPAREVWLMTYPDLRRSEAVRAVMDFVIEAMRAEFR